MIYIVLVETEGEENLGMIARGMMNMSCHKMVLINPKCDHLSTKAMNYAVHAGEILRNANIYFSLKDFLSQMDLSVAITRRIGQWRKKDFSSASLSQYLLKLRNNKVALVFGREKNGLTNEEIFDCDLISSIPSSAEFPSLNLSHAVILVLYEIFKQNDKSETTFFDRNKFNEMIDQIITTFNSLGFFKNTPKWRMQNYINKLLIRSNLDKHDIQAVKKIFNRIESIVDRLKKTQN